jgi:hypothetical protein
VSTVFINHKRLNLANLPEEKFRQYSGVIMLPKVTVATLALFIFWGNLADAAPNPLEIEDNPEPLSTSRVTEDNASLDGWRASSSSTKARNTPQPVLSLSNAVPIQKEGEETGKNPEYSNNIQQQPKHNKNVRLGHNESKAPIPTLNAQAIPHTMGDRPPLQDAAYGLMGSETATPIGQDRLLIQFGGSSFNNPNDFRNATKPNRSNDAHLDFVYGISKDFQLNASLSGKDDTIFQGLVNSGSQLQIISNVIPVQAKWRFHNSDRLQAATVVGLEAPNPFAALFFRSGKSVSYSQPNAAGTGVDSILAEDRSFAFGVGVPISYQATDHLRLHLNPRVGFFPSQLAVTSTTGNPTAIQNAGIGFNGQDLKYYGTVFGVGLGASYALSPNLQVAADFTPILAGTNSIDRANGNSLLTARPVWNVGLQYTPNNRTALGLYATNRYGATSTGPSNLLVQPGGDWAVGANVTYLQGNTGQEQETRRATYPQKAAFWGGAGGYPSTTLPSSSILYQLGVGSQRQVNPTIRYGLMDDLEVAISHNNTSRREMAIETSLMGRWGLLPDRGQDGFSGALGLGLIRIDGPGLELGYSLYAETPISYRLPGGKLSLQATPKIVIPAQFQNVPRTLALSLGANYQVFDNTQVFGSVTPSIFGSNQLVAGNSLAFQGSTPVYNLGIRQLFPSGNSTYGVEVYYGNGAGSTGYQSMSALPNGDTQFGVRLSILNGTP